MNWLLLILSLPSDNATARTRIWRTLKAQGCATLRDGAWLLPRRDDLAALLGQQAEEARAAGGSAWLLTLGPQGETDAEMAGLFERSADYASLNAELDRLTQATDEGGSALRALRALRRQFEQISAIDYFPGALRKTTAEHLESVARLVRARLNPHEPSPGAAPIPRLDAGGFQGRRWATRRNLWVDRLASAWLIQRHIDPEARFLWLDHPEDCPTDALGFDFDGADFSHVGERVSFETLLASFGLEGDAALMRIAAIVHSLDVGGSAPEAAGFEALLKGLKARIDDDDRLLAEGGRLLDDLYLAFSSANGA